MPAGQHQRVVRQRDQSLQAGIDPAEQGAQVVVLPEERVEAAAHRHLRRRRASPARPGPARRAAPPARPAPPVRRARPARPPRRSRRCRRRRPPPGASDRSRRATAVRSVPAPDAARRVRPGPVASWSPVDHEGRRPPACGPGRCAGCRAASPAPSAPRRRRTPRRTADRRTPPTESKPSTLRHR